MSSVCAVGYCCHCRRCCFWYYYEIFFSRLQLICVCVCDIDIRPVYTHTHLAPEQFAHTHADIA